MIERYHVVKIIINIYEKGVYIQIILYMYMLLYIYNNTHLMVTLQTMATEKLTISTLPVIMKIEYYEWISLLSPTDQWKMPLTHWEVKYQRWVGSLGRQWGKARGVNVYVEIGQQCHSNTPPWKTLPSCAKAPVTQADKVGILRLRWVTLPGSLMLFLSIRLYKHNSWFIGSMLSKRKGK